MKSKLRFLASLFIILTTLSFSFVPVFYAQSTFAQTYSGSISTTGLDANTIAASAPAYTANRWSETTMRNYSSQYGININSNVTLYGLGNFAVTGIVALKKTVDYYQNATKGANAPLSNITISAGTETYGMDTPVLDVLSDPALNNFINTLATSRGNGLYQLGDDYFFQTNSGWHIIFGPSNGAFVKNNINFFGIVRDNFNVSHPFITSANTPYTISFPRTLTVGSSGQDVHDLQQLLNTDPYTIVAASGPGSPGSESNYFGLKTKAAVMNYQYKNNEILDGAGITVATGIAAAFTRASMKAYGNYLNALKLPQNQAALQYPTPTKPLQDITILQPSPNSTTAAATTTIAVNTTPNAPAYVYTGSADNLPVQDPYNNDQLNNTPVFTDPSVNGTNIADPNNAANTASQSTQPSLAQTLLQSVLQIASSFLLNRGGVGGIGGLGGGGIGGINFGGYVTYNNLQAGNVPCECPPSPQYITDGNTAYSSRTGPVNLIIPPGFQLVGGTVATVGQCLIGKYTPVPTYPACRRPDQYGSCSPGIPEIPPWPLTGILTYAESCKR